MTRLHVPRSELLPYLLPFMTVLLQIADAACWIELKAASEFIPCGELSQPALHKHRAACATVQPNGVL